MEFWGNLSLSHFDLRISRVLYSLHVVVYHFLLLHLILCNVMLLDYGTRFRHLVAGKIRGNGSETLDFISIWCLREGKWPLDLACLPLFFIFFSFLFY